MNKTGPSLRQLNDQLVQNLLIDEQVEGVHGVGIILKDNEKREIEINVKDERAVGRVEQYLKNLKTGDFMINVRIEEQAKAYE